MQVLGSGYSVWAINNIIIEHFGVSTFNQVYFKNQSSFFNKWKSNLPISRGVIVDETSRILIDSLCDLTFLYRKTLMSRAYRIGKFLIFPISLIRKKIWPQNS